MGIMTSTRGLPFRQLSQIYHRGKSRATLGAFLWIAFECRWSKVDNGQTQTEEIRGTFRGPKVFAAPAGSKRLILSTRRPEGRYRRRHGGPGRRSLTTDDVGRGSVSG
jgi:hypothetical protein